MRNYSEVNKFVKTGIKPHQILFTWTSYPDWEMERKILLERVDGLDYDDTKWEGVIYTKDELRKLANADYNGKDLFWEMVRNYVG